MFEWYASAVVCYVYLSDVVRPPNATESEIKSSLAQSRWVSRGWTLQELIAPPYVVFYSRDWQVCGTRSELSAVLAEITLIDEPYLNGRPLHHASVAQRMSWAAKRTTSREEDLAYCLLGIFNVNIPLIYGEKSKAFRRLQEVIIRENPEDHSLYAWGKVVDRCSYIIRDEDQIWGSKPVKYDPSLAEQKLFSLLAESPADFMQSGQIVRAPVANGYFAYMDKRHSPPFSSGPTTQVEFPVIPWYNCAAFHIKTPPIVQIRTIKYALLLCGMWNEKRNDFYFILIPQVLIGAQVSRTNEIVVDRKLKPTVMALAGDTRQYIYKLPRPCPPQHGSILFRRVISSVADLENKIRDVVDSARLHWLSPPSSLSGMLQAMTFKIDDTRCLVVFIQRLRPLNDELPSHANGKGEGQLTFGLAIFKVLSHPTLSPSTPGIQNEAPSQLADPKTTVALMAQTKESFLSVDKGMQYFWDHTNEIPYRHEMEVPLDEWQLNLEGHVNVCIAIERMYIEDCNSDEDIGPQPDNYAVDIVDLVVRVKGDPGYEDLESSNDSSLEDGEDSNGGRFRTREARRAL
ncbi:hypothetical protein F4680DRAFT_440409 [Xylaria scruposa]|nr:hypothetical protein F4680DRAFT_440409 [Xylaria scruposa]